MALWRLQLLLVLTAITVKQEQSMSLLDLRSQVI